MTTKYSTHWDDTYQRHYYYNHETGETTWEPPGQEIQESNAPTSSLDTLFSKIDDAKVELDKVTTVSKKRRQKEDSEPVEDVQEHFKDPEPTKEEDDSPYQFEARFDVRTGKFRQAESKTIDPSTHFAPEVKAHRQMSVYFDVHAYNEQRNLERQQGEVKKKATKKEIQKYKAKKEKKKKEKLLAAYRDDLDQDH